nr:GNAT family N-acetyltransferase [Sphingomonas xinjiangensis]
MFNRRHVDPGATGPLAVLLKDADSSTIGGLWGSTLFGWLHIELLYVPEDRRGGSVGSIILRRAETLAASRGCIGASLDTYSFQARGFYEKLGYSLVGSIADCPPGGARHFLQKRFDRAALTRPGAAIEASCCPTHE